MFNKMNIKYLGIVFIVLIAIVLLLIPGRNNKVNKSFDSDLSNFEVADARYITIQPKGSEASVELEKSDDKWLVKEGKNTFNADMNQVGQMLQVLSELKAKRLAAKEKDKWSTYEVTDSLGTRVSVKGEKKVLTDVYIGKFSYKQAPPSSNPYMQNQQGTMTSFVRLADDKDVFAVDGFLSMTFNRKASDLRDKTITRVNRSSVSRLSFDLPDEQFELVKQDNNWMLNGIIADSASVAKYLSKISNQSSSNFISDAEFPQGLATHELTIFTGDQGDAIDIKAIAIDTSMIGITSSLNPGMKFNVAGSEIFNNLFKSQNYFLGEEQE